MGQKPGDNDWIVFKIKGNNKLIPRDIRIVNQNSPNGIKDINILGSPDGKEPFNEWMSINGIKKKPPYDEEEQRFRINPQTGAMFKDNNFKYIKLVIINNHGSNFRNEFWEFKMFGINGVFTVYSYISCHSPSLCLLLSDLLSVLTHFPMIPISALCTYSHPKTQMI